MDILPVPPEDSEDGEQRDNGIKKARADKNAGTIGQEIEWLQEQGTKLSFPNLGGDLPFILGRGDEIFDQQDDEKIENHLPEVVAGDFTGGITEDGTPDKDGSEEGNEAEQRSQEEVPPIDKSILKAYREDGLVFINGCPKRSHGRGERGEKAEG